MAQLRHVDQDARLPPTWRARVPARIAGLVAAVPFAQVPPPPVAALVTHVAACFDLAEALPAAPGPP
jgi:hypothetical protein